jgi:dipeptidyl-peptidase-3
VSSESESIFDFITELHKTWKGDWAACQKQAGISDADLKHFLEYSAMFLGNCGNYKKMGDTKFIPRCEEKAFAALAATSPEADKHYKATEGAIFSNNNSGIMHLGHLENGQMTTYYPDSKGLTKAEIQAVDEWIQAKKLLVVG